MGPSSNFVIFGGFLMLFLKGFWFIAGMGASSNVVIFCGSNTFGTFSCKNEFELSTS
jgi:hypothetical protein